MRAVSAVVPAAGLSRRFGGPNKLLRPFGETAGVGTVVRTLLGCGLEVVVVTGRDSDEVARAAAPARCVFNAEFELGLGSSIAAGVRATPEGSAVLVALGDMPDLRTDVVRAILEAYEEADAGAIVAPLYSEEPDRHGHPVLFSPAHRPALAALRDDSGARSVVEANRKKLVLVPAQGGLAGIDSPSGVSHPW